MSAPEPRAGTAAHASGPIPGPLGRVLAAGYGRIIAARNRRFDARRGVIEFDRPVISVGNLSVGGTGKTPMVRHLVDVLRSAGHRPCIAMRGYRSRGGESDEAAEYSRGLGDVPIVAQANRIQGLIRLFAREFDEGGPGSDCIVLDDGFQHRQIARQLDIVLIDATRSPFGDRLLPAGWLREPAASLERADLVIVTHAESIGGEGLRALEREISAVRRGRGADALASHAWTDLRVRAPEGQDTAADVGWLSGRRVVASCAIGNPGPFLAALRSAGAAVVDEIVLRDHDEYAARTRARLMDAARAGRADAIVVTEKDWSKLARAAEAWPCPVVRPQLGLVFGRGGEELSARVVAVVDAGVPEDEAPAAAQQV